jgi:hypothetical protein
VKQAIAKNVLPADTDGSKLATRADLVVGAYGGQQAYQDANKPAAVSVVSAKATGVKTVTVTFDRDVDTTKATLALTKGTAAVATTATFADDKKSATLTLTDTTLRAGDYTVTLGGLDASAIKTATGTFTAQDESVQKIDFVSSSDTIALSQNASVTVKATNQYGEAASFSTGSYTVILGTGGTAKLTKLTDGNIKITFDDRTIGGSAAQSNVSVIPVNIYFNDTHVSASKNFTVGVAPFISKAELGAVSYSNGGTAISKKGENATFDLNVYDQYGSLIGWDDPNFDKSKVQVLFTPYETNLTSNVDNYNNDGVTPQVRVSLLNNLDKSGDYTAQVLYQGASATTKISVKSVAVATKVAIGDLNDVVASGDTDVYIPVMAYDEAGNQLSTDDLTSDQNIARIHVTVSGATADATIMNSGDHKGSIHISNVTAPSKSVISVTAYIAEVNANSTATKQYTVADVRVPDHLKIATEPAKKMVAGAFTKFAVQTIDQYGKSQDSYAVVDTNGNMVTGITPATVGSNVYYYTRITPISGSATQFITSDNDQPRDPYAGTGMYTDTINFKNFSAITGSNGSVKNDAFDASNNTYRLVTKAGATDSGFKAELVKVVNNVETVVDTQTRPIGAYTSSDSLTYTMNSVPALLNTIDSGVVPSGGVSWVNNDGTTGSFTADQLKAGTSKLGRELTVSATNAAGDVVALPKSIVSVGSSNTSVAQVVYVDNTATTGYTQAYVIGNKAGTANVTVSFKAADGSIKTASTAITVKNDALTIDHITAGNTKVQSVGTGADAWNTMDIQVFDNYGVKYEKQDALHYNSLLGVIWSVSNVKNGTASIDNNGKITGTSGTTFDLIATAPSGKSATTPVKIN